jgi:hypothetical protein
MTWKPGHEVIGVQAHMTSVGEPTPKYDHVIKKFKKSFQVGWKKTCVSIIVYNITRQTRITQKYRICIQEYPTVDKSSTLSQRGFPHWLPQWESWDVDFMSTRECYKNGRPCLWFIYG